MSAWIVYDKNGLAKCEARKLEYQGEFMGSCSVNVTITSPTPIGFELGDWLEYRGERFELNYDPSVVKEASSDSYGEGFVYESIVFNSLSDELTRCDFLDYVPSDNEIHYSSLPTFSFFADSIGKLAERIQVNLDRIYTGDKKWTVEVHPEYVNTLNVNITASNNTVWDALGFVNSKFGANFIIRGRTITIGTTGLAVGQLFSYGKGNGLYKIERNAESNQKVITRLRAYGSTRNMPTDYYNNVEGGNVPNNMAVKNLMLPSFPTETHDPYIDSPNIEELGIREGTVFFDGSNDLEEIYPTMEGKTSATQGALDEVLSAEQIADDGKVPDEGEIQKTFTITLKEIGFNINDYLTGGTATISMTSGMCGGREFEIVKCEKVDSGYKLTCNRAEDSDLGLYFPYNDYQITGGDKFVLLNIEMPDEYIEEASQKLLKAAEAYLAKNDYVRYSYTLEVDNIFMARQHDEAMASGGVSLHDTIKEGDLMLFEDEDLGINGGVTIASLTIKEYADGSLVPEYGITLQDEKTVGTIEKIQNQLDSLSAYGGSGASVNTEQVTSIIKAIGKTLFLSKKQDDRSRGMVASDKGFEVGRFQQGELGSGGVLGMEEGNSYLEVDYMLARKAARFIELNIQKLRYVGGAIILSRASMKCHLVIEMNDVYRCYFLSEHEGEKISNEFVTGDLARSQTFKASEGVSQDVNTNYYWRAVVSVSSEAIAVSGHMCHYIDLSKTDCDAESGKPMAGDEIVQMGNPIDTGRQGAIVLSTVGEDAPSIKQYDGIASYSMDNARLVTKLSPKGNIISSESKIDSSDGDSLADTIENIRVNWDTVLEQTDKEFTMWFYAYTPNSSLPPESEWGTPELKALHEEDLFYCTNNEDEDNYGKVWRYSWDDETRGYVWKSVTDAATIAAMEKAISAQNLADSKVKCFVNTPTPPYSIGDIWVNAYWETDGSYFYEDDNLVCCTEKDSGGEFDINDWRPSSYATTSRIQTTEAGVEIVNKAFGLDEGNNLVVKQESGLVTTSTFSGFFSEAVSADATIKAKAEVSTSVQYDPDTGKMQSNVTISAGNVNINGITSNTSENSVVIGGFEVTETTMTATGISDNSSNVSRKMLLSPDEISMVQEQADSESTAVVESESGIRQSFDAMERPGLMYSIIKGGYFDSFRSMVGISAGYFETKADESFALSTKGSVHMASNEYGGVAIGGFSVLNRNSNATTSDGSGALLSDFIIVSSGTVTLPRASLSPGKVVFVKKTGGTLVVPNFVGAKNATADYVASKSDFENRPFIFVASGLYWYEFFCGWD